MCDLFFIAEIYWWITDGDPYWVGIEASDDDSGLNFFNARDYVNAECALRDIPGEQNKNLRVIYCTRHLAMAQDGLVAQKPATLTNYVMPHNGTLMTFWFWCRTVMVGAINS